jgi:zinc protease
MKKMILVTIAVMLMLLPAFAQTEAGAVKLPPYKEHTLENGLKVFIMESREVPLVTLRLLVPAGSAMDNSGADGAANLTGRLLQKGAAGLNADQISEMIEEVGGRLSVRTGRDFLMINADFLAKDMQRAFDIMGKVVLSPDFPREELDREKGLVTAEIQAAKEQPSGIATREFMRELVGNHPYAHPVEGTEASVGAMTRDQVLAFYRQHYVPAGSILAVVGDVNAGAALELVKATFGGWKGEAVAVGEAPALTPKKFPGRKLVVVNKPDATQSQIRIGNISVGRSTPDYFPLLVTNSVLGGGFTSRLMDEIRVNRGLSYGARSNINCLNLGGIFGVTTFTKNKTLRETIDVALDQIKRIRTEKISNTELTNSKKYITGLFPFDLETNNDLANWLLEISYYNLPRDYVDTYCDNIDRVTADDAMRVAQEQFWLDDNLILLLTNYDGVKDQLTGLGKAEVMSIDDVK